MFAILGLVLLVRCDGASTGPGEPTPLETEEAGRLFPMQINTSGVIVGLWGEHGTWWDRSRGFIATPSGDGFDVQPYRVPGDHITALSGINDAGAMAGLYNPQGNDAPARVFRASGPSALSHTLSHPGSEPRPLGLGPDRREPRIRFGHDSPRTDDPGEMRRARPSPWFAVSLRFGLHAGS